MPEVAPAGTYIVMRKGNIQYATKLNLQESISVVMKENIQYALKLHLQDISISTHFEHHYLKICPKILNLRSHNNIAFTCRFS